MDISKNAVELVIMTLPWVMLAVFCIGSFLRLMVFITVKRHDWFAKEFEKRVQMHLESEVPGKSGKASFYVLSKSLLERTYYEIFELRDRLKRRRNDTVMGFADRIFLVKPGCAWLVKDILNQLKFLKWTDETPKLMQITRATFLRNPCFNRVFGLIPIVALNDLVTILPGLFVVAGILGTFLGIARGLPELGGMNVQDLENSKLIMDRFLSEIAFAMRSSIAGIAFSLVMHIWNVLMSPERAYGTMTDRFETALDLLWYRSDNNAYPEENGTFDEHKDPSAALATSAVQNMIKQHPRQRDADDTTVKKPEAS